MGLTVLLFCYLYVVTEDPANFRVILVSGQFIFGMCGSYTVFLMGVMCYVSDATATKPYTRKLAYSITEAVLFTPQVFSPSIVGVWVQVDDYTLPMLTMTCVSAVGIAYTLWMPESLSPDSESRKIAIRYDFFQTIRNLKFLFQYECEDGSSPLPWLGGALMLHLVSWFGSNAVFIIYVKHKFDWKSGAIGIYDGIKGLLVVISMLFLTSGYKKLFNSQLSLLTWIQVGLFFRIMFTASLGLVQSSLGIILVTSLTLFTGPIMPYSKTVLSNTVTPLAQAQVFSAVSAIEGLSGLSGPLFDAILVGLLKVNLAWVIFEIAAVIVVMAFCMIYYIRTSPSMAQNLPQETKVETSTTSSYHDYGLIGSRGGSRSRSRSMSGAAGAGGLVCFDTVYEQEQEGEGEEEREDEGEGEGDETRSLLREEERESYR